MAVTAVVRPMPPWLAIARKEMGVTEKAGTAANPRIIAYFAAAGARAIKHDEVAWCSAFANFCLEKAGYKGTMSLAARSFQNYGKASDPVRGAIAVFPRGKSSWQGHVTFVDEVVGHHVWCVGGNQNNRVNRTRYKISDALAFRWPPSMGGSRTVAAMTGGSISTGANFLLEQAQEAQVVTSSLQEYVSWATYATLGLIIACFGLGIWFRWQDMRDKGR